MSFLRIPLFSATLSAACLLADTATTQQGVGQSMPVRTYVVRPQPLPRGPSPAIPAPPREIFDSPKKHGSPTIPEGPLRVSDHRNPPLTIVTASPNLIDAESYTDFLTRDIRPSASSNLRSRVTEPAITHVNEDVAWMTSNWFAARSTDAGDSWNYVHAYTQFTRQWGAFCCDQRVLAHDNRMVYLLQYATDLQGNSGYSIGVATNSSAAGSNNFAHVINVDPQDFGYPDDRWFDFPDVAFTDDHFFVAANIFQGNNYRGSMVLRFRNAQVFGGSSLSVDVFDSPSGIHGSSFRLAQGGTSDMYFASHLNTSTLRVFEWSGGSTAPTQSSVSIDSWSSTLDSAPAPDGLDWTGRYDNRILGAWTFGDRAGFLWNCGPRGTDRPRNYVRHVFLDTTTMTVTRQHDIHTEDDAIMCPAAAPNAWGHVAVTFAIGGPLRYPGNGTILYDDIEDGDAIRIFGTSNHGPGQSEWSDYFTMQGFPSSTAAGSFVASGQDQRAGGSNSNSRVRYHRFGRAAFGTVGTAAILLSDPIDVVIQVSPNDGYGQAGSRTPFYRQYVEGTTVTVTAPGTATTSSGDFAFRHWTHEAAPGSAPTQRPSGQLSFSYDLGSADDRFVAYYGEIFTLSLGSSANVSGVPISFGQADVDGSQGGATPLTRRYVDGDTITVSAPSVFGMHRLSHWTVDGVDQPEGQHVLTLSIAADQSLVANYLEPDCYEPDLGTALGMGDESLAQGLPLGFDFPLQDGTTTDRITVSSNGFLWLAATGGQDNTPSRGDLVGSAPRIAAAWHDLSFDGDGDDVYFQALPGRAVVTWHQAVPLDTVVANQFLLHTAQCTLFADGQVHLSFSGDWSYLNRVVVGAKLGSSSTDPGSMDLSSGSVSSGSTPSLYEDFDYFQNRFDLEGRVLSLGGNGQDGVSSAPAESACQLGMATAYGEGCPPPASFAEFGQVDDLAGRSLQFVPNASGGYLVRWCPANCFDADLGTLVSQRNDSVSVRTSLHTFPYPGNAAGTTEISVSTNGFVYLARSTDPGVIPRTGTLVNDAPRIAAFWTDLDPSTASADGVYFKALPNRTVITWKDVHELGSPTVLLTVQMQLYANGLVTLSYSGDLTTRRDVLVGFSPGRGEAAATPVDFVTDVPFHSGAAGGDRLTLSGGAYRPTVGQPFLVETSNVPTGSLGGALILGFVQQSIDLSILGMQGCFVLSTNDVQVPLTLTTANEITSLPIPNTSILLGHSVYLQSALIAPGINQAGAATSNGLQVTIGKF